MRFLISSLIAGACILPLHAQAQTQTQSYPNKPIKILVGYPAGGATDASARAIADQLGSALGQPVIVENRAGATGNIAAEAAARSAPDGYTLFLSTSVTTASLSLVKKLGYHPLDSFAPISRVVSLTSVLVTNPAVPAKDVNELVAYAKANPGKLTYASSGIGSSPHLAGALFSMLADIRMLHVPYKGGAQAMTDLLGGHVALSFSNPTSVMPHIATGKVRGFAVTGPSRFAGLPELPTMVESGYPDFVLTAWYGLVAPAGTPPEIVKRLNAEVVKILNNPEVKSQLLKEGQEASPSTPDELRDEIKADIVTYAKILKAAGIEPE